MDERNVEGTPETSRRDFCRAAGCTLSTLAFWGAALPASAEPARTEDVSPKELAETKASLSPGTVKDYRKLGNFFLMADAGGVYAVSSICTHAGCSVRNAGSGFECACHGSAFDFGGAVTQGPAKLALKHYEVKEKGPGGPLVVDLNKSVAPHVRL